MGTPQIPPLLPTVSYAFLEDWLGALRKHSSPQQMAQIQERAGLAVPQKPQERAARTRVTHDQIIKLYQIVVEETKDEMMGLWSRPIRFGALKHLCASVRGASSLSAALYRFTSFWNLLLDDNQMTLETQNGHLRVVLAPIAPHIPQRFGHMLLLKLTHGIGSWLAGHELPLSDVGFIFDRPTFAEDYPILFPAPIKFGQKTSYISFEGAPDGAMSGLLERRSDAEMQDFLIRAPRDWIFTSMREHALPLRVRELLLLSNQLEGHLGDTAQALNLTPRTLMRRLDAEGTSFQGIKDGLRRDIAIRDLTHGTKSIEAISQDIGFASSANFYRAFKRWTDVTPGAYRQGAPRFNPK